MTWTDWVLVGSQLLAFVGAVVFVSRYSHRVWEASPHGRNIMAGSLGIGVAALLAALHRVYHPRTPVAYLLEAVVWAGLGVVLCHRGRLLAADPRQPSSHDTQWVAPPSESDVHNQEGTT